MRAPRRIPRPKQCEGCRRRAARGTVLAATGGFQRRARVTLLFAVADRQVRVVRGLLAAHCRAREEWRGVAPEHLDPHAPPDPPVPVPGAIVFILRIVRHERLLPPEA